MTKLAVKERPILFSAPMVRAILEGRKTQMRMVMQQPPIDDFPSDSGCHYGVPGDRLWVRESFWRGHSWQWVSCEDKDWVPNGDNRYGPEKPITAEDAYFKHVPGIHMPRRLSRITLEITEVRVQRVQEISEEDALAEGIHVGARAAEDGKENHCRICGEHRRRHVGVAMACFGGMGTVFDPATYRGGFRFLWDSINAKRGFRWDGNPWVWAISFKRIGVMP